MRQVSRDLTDMLAPFSRPGARTNEKAVEKAVDSLANYAVLKLCREKDGARKGEQ